MTGKIHQLIYGSVPISCGYSLLGKSQGITDELKDNLIQICESYDAQEYSAPPTPYSVSCFHLQEDKHILLEVFGGWRDQVGRASRVMRTIILDEKTWQCIAGNPFVLCWILPPIKKCITKKRNEVKDVDIIDVEKISKRDWYLLWKKETRVYQKILSRLSIEEEKWLFYLREQDNPFLEIATDSDCSKFCRALAYSMDKEKRLQLPFACESFSLNRQKPAGICFRHKSYCEENGKTPPSQRIPKSLSYQLEVVTHSLPKPYNFEVIVDWWKRKSLKAHIITVLLLIVILILIFKPY